MHRRAVGRQLELVPSLRLPLSHWLPVDAARAAGASDLVSYVMPLALVRGIKEAARHGESQLRLELVRVRHCQ